jgi:hypothetical protein
VVALAVLARIVSAAVPRRMPAAGESVA